MESRHYPRLLEILHETIVMEFQGLRIMNLEKLAKELGQLDIKETIGLLKVDGKL